MVGPAMDQQQHHVFTTSSCRNVPDLRKGHGRGYMSRSAYWDLFVLQGRFSECQGGWVDTLGGREYQHRPSTTACSHSVGLMLGQRL